MCPFYIKQDDQIFYKTNDHIFYKTNDQIFYKTNDQVVYWFSTFVYSYTIILHTLSCLTN